MTARHDELGLDGVAVVLVEPKRGGNVGATARAMANMGASDLRLVAPTYRDEEEALLLAHGAEDVYRGRRTYARLAEAVADREWIVGATRRDRPERSGPFDPRMFSEELAERAGAPIAVVLGREDGGLTNEELDLCGGIVRIPSHPGQPSLNLAQAALVLLWEARSAVLGRRHGPPRRGVGPRAAPSEAREAFYERLGPTLLRVGYAEPDTVEARVRFFRDLLSRAGPSLKELERLTALLHRIDRAVGHPTGRRTNPDTGGG